MAKSLSNISSTSTLASVVSGIVAAAFRPFLSGSGKAALAEALPARLRYDIGELDTNPDFRRDRAAGAASGLAREIMRRHI